MPATVPVDCLVPATMAPPTGWLVDLSVTVPVMLPVCAASGVAAQEHGEHDVPARDAHADASDRGEAGK